MTPSAQTRPQTDAKRSQSGSSAHAVTPGPHAAGIGLYDIISIATTVDLCPLLTVMLNLTGDVLNYHLGTTCRFGRER
jgi:hypothetical protein